VFFVAVGVAFLQFFFAMAVCGVLQGFLGKMGGRTSCFDGEFVVECVVKLASRQPLFEPRKMGQGLWIYF
jgi:hypothetical protein